jgi:DNA-binding response OmpR family regulator
VSVTTILVVDDSATERAIVERRLESSGYRVFSAENGRAALRTLYQVKPDLVLLDVVMPELDGWQTLEQIRNVSDVPVIMLTAKNSEIERVRGLRSGADDYLGKPFGAGELSARIEALLRRAATRAPSVREVFDDGTVHFDAEQAHVTVRGDVVALTPLEFRLLGALTSHVGQVLSRDQLLRLAWGTTNDVGPGRVKLYVGYLRKKIEVDPARPELVETVRGYGYRYRTPLAPAA